MGKGKKKTKAKAKAMTLQEFNEKLSSDTGSLTSLESLIKRSKNQNPNEFMNDIVLPTSSMGIEPNKQKNKRNWSRDNKVVLKEEKEIDWNRGEKVPEQNISRSDLSDNWRRESQSTERSVEVSMADESGDWRRESQATKRSVEVSMADESGDWRIDSQPIKAKPYRLNRESNNWRSKCQPTKC